MKNAGKNSAAALGMVCWIVYFSIYLGRLNFSASMGDMTQTGLWGKTELGSVAAAFYLAYGLAQIPCGILGDKISPKKLVSIGLIGTTAANLLFPFVDSVTGMQILWFLNGVSQAMIWPPVVKMVINLTYGQQSVNIILMLSFTAPAGMLAAYLLDAVMLKAANWRYCFWSAGIWLAAVVLLWQIAIPIIEKKIEKVQKPIQNTQPGKRQVNKKKISLAVSMVIPIVNLSGVYMAGYGNRTLFKNETKTGAVFFGVSVVCIVLMMTGLSLPGSMVVFAVVTSMMTGVNTLFVSLLPMHFRGEGKVSTATGVLNAITHLGSAAASILFGVLTEKFGWGGTEFAWCLCGIAGMFCCIIPIKRWGINRKNIYTEY